MSKCCLLIAAGLLAPTTSWANCVSTLFPGTCSATVSATALSFGLYNANNGVATDAVSTVTVTGRVSASLASYTTLSYSISMSGGMASSISDRRMTGGSGGSSLAYNLYMNSNRDVLWGVNSVNDSRQALAVLLGTSWSTSYTVYGRIPARQYVSVGNYADTVTVTVNY